MKPLLRLASMAAAVVALGAPAPAQIISTSLPRMTPGQEHKKFSAHFMITPLAKWNYKEAYIESSSIAVEDVPGVFFASTTEGAINGSPNSKFMAAGEVAFALGDSDWSLTVGGWFNRLGSHDFDLPSYTTGAFIADTGDLLFGVGGPATQRWTLDMDMYEGHLGVFYKAFGVQFGFVRTETTKRGEPFALEWVTVAGATGAPPELPSGKQSFDLAATNDWSVHGVFRKSAPRWGVSAGLGAYVLKGISTKSPLRFGSDQTVLSTFATGSVTVFGPVGIDVSFWYLGSTARYSDYKNDLEARPVVCSAPILDISDCSSFLKSNPLKLPSGIDKSRLTVGIGFSF
jgi:hypothetical protein